MHSINLFALSSSSEFSLCSGWINCVTVTLILPFLFLPILGSSHFDFSVPGQTQTQLTLEQMQLLFLAPILLKVKTASHSGQGLFFLDVHVSPCFSFLPGTIQSYCNRFFFLLGGAGREGRRWESKNKKLKTKPQHTH